MFISGRKGLLRHIEQTILSENPSRSDIVWFHCPSVGEFEQARPLIERLRESSGDDFKILLTFFSPSGYELRKNYNLVDWVFYLPFDSPRRSSKFLEIVNPKVAFFVKYDFWYYYLSILKKKNVPTYIISAIFRKGQPFFMWWGTLWREMINCFTTIFVQNEESKILLSQIGVTNVEIVGDTRFDRVYRVVQQSEENDVVKEFSKGKRCVVAGSTWPMDEIKLFKLLKETDLSLIIAPHEVYKNKIDEIVSMFEEYSPICYSNLILSSTISVTQMMNSKVLIIDTIGILSSLYRYGDFAYIGGGFGVGIHNTLEAVTYGKGVVFGPNYLKFQEAKDLISLGCAHSFEDEDELVLLAQRWISSPEILKEISIKSKNYISQGVGATEKIYNSVFLK